MGKLKVSINSIVARWRAHSNRVSFSVDLGGQLYWKTTSSRLAKTAQSVDQDAILFAKVIGLEQQIMTRKTKKSSFIITLIRFPIDTQTQIIFYALTSIAND